MFDVDYIDVVIMSVVSTIVTAGFIMLYMVVARVFDGSNEDSISKKIPDIDVFE